MTFHTAEDDTGPDSGTDTGDDSGDTSDGGGGGRRDCDLPWYVHRTAHPRRQGREPARRRRGGCGGDGEDNLTSDPRFNDPEVDDFTLDSLSPAIDMDNPAAGYNDVDGTRNGMGAFGGVNGSW